VTKKKVVKRKPPTPTELKRRIAELEGKLRQLEYGLEHNYEPRPKDSGLGFYVTPATGLTVAYSSWQARCKAQEANLREAHMRMELSESAHRAMAEALATAAHDAGAGALAVISAWAGRGMVDKPPEAPKS